MTSSKTLALDADGVLLDYNQAYAALWERAFGVRPLERDPEAYWARDRFGLAPLEAAELAHFRSHFGEAFWAAVPALPGAVAACEALVSAGYELVCVSALPPEFADTRLRNLRGHGFPIERVLATGHDAGTRSPKADAINALAPLAFVDDYLPYMRGVAATVHKALVMRGPGGSPNTGPELADVHSQHGDLPAFSRWWLGGRRLTDG
jgi:phosphoglycolate phosphatase-like HAD superfamily hydrolase